MVDEPIISTAERTLRLLELFQSRPEGWTPQELLPELDLSRSALFVLLRAFKTLGYIEQTGKRGRYVPGPRLLAWRAPQTPSSQDLLTAFFQEAELAQLSNPTIRQETLALALPAGKSGWVVTGQVEGNQQVKSALMVGQGYASIPAAEPLFSSGPSAEIIQNGYCLAEGAETFDLALPICRDGFTPEAALLFSAPSFRWSGDRFVETYLAQLREMAAHLSYRLGAPFYTPFRSKSPNRLQNTAALDVHEISQFLQGPYAASLACVRPDGKPHVIPVWQEWDGQDFHLIAWHGSQWAEYVGQNPNVSMTIDEPWTPLRRVVVQGSAQPLKTGQPEIERLIQRLTHRYLGQAAVPGTANQVQCVFQVHPNTIRGWRGLL